MKEVPENSCCSNSVRWKPDCEIEVSEKELVDILKSFQKEDFILKVSIEHKTSPESKSKPNKMRQEGED